MVELKEMTREELLGVIDIKNMRIKELEEEVELLRSLLIGQKEWGECHVKDDPNF